MKNTNTKTLILEIVSLIVVVGLIGGGVALISQSVKNAEDALDDAYGDLQGTETSPPSSDSTSSDSSDTSSDTTVTDDGIFSFAEGDIKIGLRGSTEANLNVFIFYINGLKANTEYTIRWSFDSTYEAYRFDFAYQEVNGVQRPYVRYTLSSTDIYTNTLTATSPSKLLNSFYTITTSDEGYFEMAVFETPDVGSSVGLQDQMESFRQLINYIEIEEVS